MISILALELFFLTQNGMALFITMNNSDTQVFTTS